MHKLFKKPNTLWDQHLKQIAWMRFISILLFPLSLIFSLIALAFLIANNSIYFVFDCIAFAFLFINLLSIFGLIIWICIEGTKANKTLSKISNEEYQTFRENILKNYPNFWSITKK